MNKRLMLIFGIFMSMSTYLGVNALAEAPAQDMKSFFEKTKQESEARSEHMKELRAMIEDVKSRIPATPPKVETGTSKTIRQASEKELAKLQADLEKLKEEGLKANVEAAQKQVEFANQRLDLAKESLKKFQEKIQ